MQTGVEFFINLASVRAVRKSDFSAGSSIVFEDGNAVSVDGGVVEIVKLLEEAMTG